MRPSNRPAKPADTARQTQIQAELRRDVALRRQSYREQALRVLPHLCASCGRAFTGTRLRELTVHHRDHNHLNNPPDGSNWELLCLYCHDHEHEKSLLGGFYEGRTATRDAAGPGLADPFAKLDTLLQSEPPAKSENGVH
jgi:5-methylcytosine-specific restriction endonuclease McrA